jgi:hypothetical protein
VKRVPVVIGRNNRNVEGRRLLIGDIDSDLEADAPANLPQAGSISNLPVDSDLDDADPESDSGRYSSLIHPDLFISIHDLFISILYLYASSPSSS